MTTITLKSNDFGTLSILVGGMATACQPNRATEYTRKIIRTYFHSERLPEIEEVCIVCESG